jgi:hypothetical protein
MSESPAQPNFQALNILWRAFMTTIGVYIVMAYVLRQGREASADLTVMEPIFAGAAAVLTILAFAGARLLAQMEYQAYCLVRLAMVESVGVFGLLLAMLGSSPTMATAFFGWALFSLLRLRPTPEDYQQYRLLRSAR